MSPLQFRKYDTDRLSKHHRAERIWLLASHLTRGESVSIRKVRMTKRSAILIMLAIVVVSVALGGRWFIRRGFSARDEPSRLEVVLARYVRHLAVPRQQREAKNPIPASEEILNEASRHFADHCAFCHGNDGSGQTEVGKNFYPKPPNLREEETQSLSDGELFYIINNGIRFTGMPAWGEGRPEDERDSWELVHFIRHLPKITDGELERMKQFNPSTQEERDRKEEEERFLRGENPPVSTDHPHH